MHFHDHAHLSVGVKAQTSPVFKLPKSLVILGMLSLRYVVLKIDTNELSMISWRFEEVVFLEVGYTKFAYLNVRNNQMPWAKSPRVEKNQLFLANALGFWF